MAAQFQLDYELDERILAALRSSAANEMTKEILRTIASHCGAGDPIAIREILMILKGSGDERSPSSSESTGDESAKADWGGFVAATDRDVKAAVKDLIEVHGIPIGGSRVPPYGYFLIVSPADLAAALSPLKHELRSLSRRVRALSSKQELARLFGQIQLELDSQGQAT